MAVKTLQLQKPSSSLNGFYGEASWPSTNAVFYLCDYSERPSPSAVILRLIRELSPAHAINWTQHSVSFIRALRQALWATSRTQLERPQVEGCIFWESSDEALLAYSDEGKMPASSYIAGALYQVWQATRRTSLALTDQILEPFDARESVVGILNFLTCASLEQRDADFALHIYAPPVRLGRLENELLSWGARKTG